MEELMLISMIVRWLILRTKSLLSYQNRSVALTFMIVYALQQLRICDAQFMVEVLEKAFAGYRIVFRCDASDADFGLDIPLFNRGYNLSGCAQFTVPFNACEDTTFQVDNSTICMQNFAVVPRGNCSFSEKAYHVQRAVPFAYQGIIIYDKGNPIHMIGNKYANDVFIPVIMVSDLCMINIMQRYPARKGYLIAIRSIPGYFELLKYLVPFIAVVAFCFAVLFVSLLIRFCRERRQITRKRLSKKNLKKIPTQKYKRGEMRSELCVICLDDFTDGERIRILPCGHVYHCKCVDPWLTKNRKVCPICKRKVYSSGNSDSSNSDTERRTESSSTDVGNTWQENAPLLRHDPVASNFSAYQSQHGASELNVQSSNSDSQRSAFASTSSTRLFLENSSIGDAVAASEEFIPQVSLRNRLNSIFPIFRTLFLPGASRAAPVQLNNDSGTQRECMVVESGESFAAENNAFEQ